MMTPEDTAAPLELTGTVLCIEDQLFNMTLVEEMLSAFPGIKFLKAFNGRDGVRLAQAERPDLVLLDMRLPDIGGLEVVRALSEQISQRKLRIVLPTGDSFSIDVVKAMSLKARPGGVPEFAKANRYGIEVFVDKNTGNYLFISDTGSIAVVAGKK